MKSAPFFTVALCAPFVLAQSYAPAATDQPDSGLLVVASASVAQSYYPFTLSPQKALDAHSSDSFELMSSTWNTTLTVVNASSSFQSSLSLSWPPGEGPGANDTVTSPWGVCTVAMPGLFDLLGVAAPGNGSCIDVMGKKCVQWLLTDIGGTFQDLSNNGSSDEDEAPLANNATAVCEKLSRVAIPPFCLHGRDEEEGEATPFQAHTTLNPHNETPFLVGTDSGNDARAKALSRAWPLVVVEFAGNMTAMTAMTCPVADASHNSGGNGSSPTGTMSAQDKPKKNGAHTPKLPVQLLALAGIALSMVLV